MTWKPRRVFVPFQFQRREQRKQKNMDAKTYQECALRTMADQSVILNRLSAEDMQTINGVIGLANEVGELADALKRHVEYGKLRDRVNIKEEVGDCFWRLRQICDAVGLTFEECMQGNIDKLKIRYPKEFSDILAAEENRDREAERQAMLTEAKDVMDNSTGGRILPENWDKSPYPQPVVNQTGHGWAEPEEIVDLSGEDLPSSVHLCLSENEYTIAASPPIARKSLNHSYTRYCTCCNIQPIHKTNTSGICTPCFMKHGEPKETENDTATTG